MPGPLQANKQSQTDNLNIAMNLKFGNPHYVENTIRIQYQANIKPCQRKPRDAQILIYNKHAKRRAFCRRK